jgi:hypothetical protein
MDKLITEYCKDLGIGFCITIQNLIINELDRRINDYKELLNNLEGFAEDFTSSTIEDKIKELTETKTQIENYYENR